VRNLDPILISEFKQLLKTASFVTVSGWDTHHTFVSLHFNCVCWNFCLLLLLFAHQHKAASVKTKQIIKQWLQPLLIRCSLCWGRRPHSPAAGIWTGVETERLFLFSGDDCGASASYYYCFSSPVLV